MITATEKLPALLTRRGEPVEPLEAKLEDVDGSDHINIASTGATELGRLLTHFAYTPFIHPIYGPFKTMEGFWHYIKSEERDDAFRAMTGGKAKAYAKGKKTVKRPNFIAIIKEANFHKIEQTEGLKELLVASTLPFKYYYFFGDEKVQIVPTHAAWLCQIFEELRTICREGKRTETQPLVDFTQRADPWFNRRG